MTWILGSSRSAIVASRRDRRRQNDDRAARSADPSLRNRRDWQRVLALQKPRLSATPACPGGQTGSSRAPLRLTRGVTPLRAGPSYSLPGQACPNAREGSRLDADNGLNFNAD